MLLPLLLSLDTALLVYPSLCLFVFVLIPGYKRFDGEKVGKDVLFKVDTREGLVEHYTAFFSNSDGIRADVIAACIPMLEELLAYFEEKPTARFYSSSILFVCDGTAYWCMKLLILGASPKPKVNVRMIDFAHVYPIEDGGKDDGYIFGLKYVIEILKELSA